MTQQAESDGAFAPGDPDGAFAPDVPDGAFAPDVPDGAFAPGTRIATLSSTGVMGEAAIESLRPGDTVLTLLGPDERATAVRQVRRQRADPRIPVVRIRAGALAPAMPAADLVLPATGLLRLRESLPSDVPVGEGEDPGMLVPAAALLNSASVDRDSTGPGEWFVLDLGESSVILANATAAASANGTRPRCLAIMPAGETLNRHRQRIAARANATPSAPAAPPPPVQPEPAPPAEEPGTLPVIVLAAGKPVPVENVGAWQFLCTLPARSGPVRLRSTPRRAADAADGRRFGICLRAVELNEIRLDFASQSFGPGFHPAEGEGDNLWRWTNGDAWLVLPYSIEPRRLVLTLTDWHTGLALA